MIQHSPPSPATISPSWRSARQDPQQPYRCAGGAAPFPCSVAPSRHSSPDGRHAANDTGRKVGTAARSPGRDSAFPPLVSAPTAAVPTIRPPGCFSIRSGTPLIGFALLFAAPALAQESDMESRARSAATATRAKSGDSDSLRGNYLLPGLAGEPVSTVDGSRRFSTSLACQKSATMLELVVQPGPTGDITRLSIARDSDLDGSFESHLTLPVPVSGICANGIISCAPGSWNQCRPFQWALAPAGEIKLDEVNLESLSGCYCVNASCGTDLVLGNLPSVLSDLGGGVVGALTTADPRIGVTQASIEGPVIRYVGAQTTACSASPTVSATQYRAAPTAIQGDASAASRASPVFTALAGSPSATGKAEQTRSCTIMREIAVEEPIFQNIISRSAGGFATIPINANTVRFQMGSPVDDSLKGGRCTIIEFRMTLDVKDRDRLRAFTLTRYYADDWAQVHIDGQQLVSGPLAWTGSAVPARNCERGRSFTRTPHLDLLSYMGPGSHEILLRVAVGGDGEALAEFEAIIDDSCKVEERLVDLCSGYADAAQCRLLSEQVDGVETVRQGVHTGLTPLLQTRLFGTGRCTYQYSRDFFDRTRRYSCVSDSVALTPPDLSRGAHIIDRSTETLLADQVRNADGSIAQTTRPFALPDRPAVAACEPVCKTRAPSANAGVGAEAIVAAQQNVPVGWNSYYHACQADNICPAGPGEEVVSACGCLDDFPEAVVMMQAVRLAGADLACTAAVR